MTGYDKSPEYAPQGGRWTLAIWLMAVFAGAGTIMLLMQAG